VLCSFLGEGLSQMMRQPLFFGFSALSVNNFGLSRNPWKKWHKLAVIILNKAQGNQFAKHKGTKTQRISSCNFSVSLCLSNNLSRPLTMNLFFWFFAALRELL
jgi:hypothetical protein